MVIIRTSAVAVIIQAVSAGSIAGWPWAKAGDAAKVAAIVAAGPCTTPRVLTPRHVRGSENRVARQCGIILGIRWKLGAKRVRAGCRHDPTGPPTVPKYRQNDQILSNYLLGVAAARLICGHPASRRDATRALAPSGPPLRTRGQTQRPGHDMVLVVFVLAELILGDADPPPHRHAGRVNGVRVARHQGVPPVEVAAFRP